MRIFGSSSSCVWLFLSLLVTAPCARVSWADFKQMVGEQELLRHGQELYQQRCVGCHGVKGDGQGPGALFLDPKPRNFTTGVFKFRSTPLDTLPTDQDLMRTITQGLHGTSMPGFPLVPEISRLAVVQYLKTFSKAWQQKENYASSLPLAPLPREDFRDPERFLPRAWRGRQLYLENCVVCHGLEGRGDGEGGQGLVNDWGEPLAPANLRKPSLKTGKTVQAIYQVMKTGVGGTPMPSFNEVLTDQEIWDVAAYVLYLRGVEAKLYPTPPIPAIQASEWQ